MIDDDVHEDEENEEAHVSSLEQRR
jgi:hypothetical protein